MFLLEFFELLKDYFTENHRNILVTALGLIFIVSIFSVTLTSEHGAKYDYISNQLESSLVIPFANENYEYSATATTFEQRIASTTSALLNKVDQHELSELISYEELASAVSRIRIIVNETGEYPLIDWEKYVGTLNGDLTRFFDSSPRFEGRMPLNSSEVILIKGITEMFYVEDAYGIQQVEELYKYELNQVINVSRSEYDENARKDHYYNYTVQIVGIYDTPYIQQLDYGYYRQYLADSLIAENPIIETNTFYFADYSNLSVALDALKMEDYEVRVSCQFKMDLSGKIDPSTFGAVSDTIDRFLRDVSWSSRGSLWRYVPYSTGEGYRRTGMWQIDEFSKIRNELASSALMNFFLMVPALSITIMFSSFASNVFFEKRKRQIGLLRVRGFSRKQLLGVLTVEGVLSALTALVVGYLLGVGLASVTTKSNEFLNYRFAVESVVMSPGTFNTILLWTFFIAGSIILSRIIRLSRLDVMESRNPTEKKPFWRRLYLDVALFILGIIGNALYFILIFNPQTMMQLGILALFAAIFVLLLMPFPFFLLFGGLMTLSRLIPPFVSFTSKKIWHRFANLFSYSLVTMKKESAIRSILLISLIFAMIWAVFTIPPVMTINNERTSFYSVGADAYLPAQWNATTEAMFADDSNLTDFTRVGAFSMSGNTQLEIFIICPDFLDVAYFENSFGSTSAIKSLFDNNRSIMMDNNGLKSGNREVGDTMTIKSNGSLEVEIVGSFKYWPRVITQIDPYFDVYGYYGTPKVVISNETFNEFNQTGLLFEGTTINTGYYFKLAGNANITALKESYGNNLQIASDLIEGREKSLVYQMTWIQLNVLFIVTICTIVLTITLYGYRQVKGRARELSVERSLGMKQFQMSRLFIYESVAILGFSYIFGTVLGIVFSTSVASIVIMGTMSYSLPPPIIFFPVDVINVVIGMLVLIGIVSSIIPAIMARRQDITQSLKVS
ncbi:MAG: FtsX-like permease family protein [Candidatus Odinarchaeota archaeon]